MQFNNIKSVKNQPLYNKIISIFYALLIAFLTFLFFTNDFGLVDIRKISVVVGLGIDKVDEGVQVTAQIGIPQPSESGENTQFTQISGTGQTVGDAIKVINAKTGFYPKLIFSKLIVLGDSCQNANIIAILDYFYRNEYTQLTPMVAMCAGSASDLFSQTTSLGDNVTSVIEQLLSDEAKMSGNVATVNLKKIGISQNSPSVACYMPYIEVLKDDQSQDNQANQSGSSSGATSGGESGGATSTQSGNSSDNGSKEAQFICTKTAMFSDGKFCGLLNEQQAFALNLIENDIKHTFIPCEVEGVKYTIGMRECKGDLKINVEGNEPKLSINFSAVCQIQDKAEKSSPQANSSKVVPDDVLTTATLVLEDCFTQLFESISTTNCDILSLKSTLYKSSPQAYKIMSQNLTTVTPTYTINLKSSA